MFTFLNPTDFQIPQSSLHFVELSFTHSLDSQGTPLNLVSTQEKSNKEGSYLLGVQCNVEDSNRQVIIIHFKAHKFVQK